jgi:hypothetical protein
MIYFVWARTVLRTIVAAFISYGLYRVARSQFEIAVISLLVLVYLTIRSSQWKEPPEETPTAIQSAIWLDIAVDGVVALVAVLALLSLAF